MEHRTPASEWIYLGTLSLALLFLTKNGHRPEQSEGNSPAPRPVKKERQHSAAVLGGTRDRLSPARGCRMMRHGIEARQGRNRLLAGSIHQSPAPKGTPRQKKKQIGDDLTVASANLDSTIKRSKNEKSIAFTDRTDRRTARSHRGAAAGASETVSRKGGAHGWMRFDDINRARKSRRGLFLLCAE